MFNDHYSCLRFHFRNVHKPVKLFNRIGVYKTSNQLLALVTVVSVVGFILSIGEAVAEETNVLTLQEAEVLALSEDPRILQIESERDALTERSISDRQLPDPKVRIGVANLPVDTFQFDAEPMTQAQIGVSQSVPRGKSLSLKSERSKSLSDSREAARRNEIEKIRLNVRRSWIDRYYFGKSAIILEKNREVFADLIAVVESLYSTGRQTQQDILRADLELQLLNDRLIDVRGNEEKAKATLAMWIGGDAYRPLPDRHATLSDPDSLDQIRNRLVAHPAIRMQDEVIRAQRSGVDLAKQEYKPSWKLDLGYGYRDGQDLLGQDRSDFVSAMVTFDVPLFPKNRQSRRVAACNLELMAARYARDDKLRAMAGNLDAEYSNWVRLGERQDLYDAQVSNRAQENLAATLQSYQSDVTDFSALMRAQLIDLETQLMGLRISTDRLKSQSVILYLQGVEE